MNDEKGKFEAIERIVGEILKQRFQDSLHFTVAVQRQFDDVGPGDGSPYLDIRIGVDGDFDLVLDPKWTSEFVTNMGDTFVQHGIDDEPSPVTSFFRQNS
jgi:hypothetical protein